MKQRYYYYAIMAVALKNLVIGKIATPQAVGVLSIVSECLNPFKMSSPSVYACKVLVDTFKEAGKFSLMCGGVN